MDQPVTPRDYKSDGFRVHFKLSRAYRALERQEIQVGKPDVRKLKGNLFLKDRRDLAHAIETELEIPDPDACSDDDEQRKKVRRRIWRHIPRPKPKKEEDEGKKKGKADIIPTYIRADPRHNKSGTWFSTYGHTTQYQQNKNQLHADYSARWRGSTVKPWWQKLVHRQPKPNSTKTGQEPPTQKDPLLPKPPRNGAHPVTYNKAVQEWRRRNVVRQQYRKRKKQELEDGALETEVVAEDKKNEKPKTKNTAKDADTPENLSPNATELASHSNPKSILRRRSSISARRGKNKNVTQNDAHVNVSNSNDDKEHISKAQLAIPGLYSHDAKHFKLQNECAKPDKTIKSPKTDHPDNIVKINIIEQDDRDLGDANTQPERPTSPGSNDGSVKAMTNSQKYSYLAIVGGLGGLSRSVSSRTSGGSRSSRPNSATTTSSSDSSLSGLSDSDATDARNHKQLTTGSKSLASGRTGLSSKQSKSGQSARKGKAARRTESREHDPEEPNLTVTTNSAVKDSDNGHEVPRAKSAPPGKPSAAVVHRPKQYVAGADADDEKPLKAARFLYDLCDCQRVGKPDTIDRLTRRRRKAAGVIMLYGCPKEQPSIIVCPFCSVFPRRRINAWLTDIVTVI